MKNELVVIFVLYIGHDWLEKNTYIPQSKQQQERKGIVIPEYSQHND